MLIEQHLIFKGIVQGVGFRFTMFKFAEELDLKGTVKNLSDGTVEAYLQGKKESIDLCIEKLKSHFGSKISTIILKQESIPTQHFSSFQII
ncbi:MAG TPA: acylphosphatase [Parachlamydiaceae bacterium]|nr:acylphosphatase [Parachlamydiaceae bacterium]